MFTSQEDYDKFLNEEVVLTPEQEAEIATPERTEIIYEFMIDPPGTNKPTRIRLREIAEKCGELALGLKKTLPESKKKWERIGNLLTARESWLEICDREDASEGREEWREEREIGH
jgi:hypothetical protein